MAGSTVLLRHRNNVNVKKKCKPDVNLMSNTGSACAAN